MDIISTIYKELFSVLLVHNDYASPNGSEIFNQLRVVPDDDTKLLFARYQMDYRLVNDTIVCFIRSRLAAPPAKEPKSTYVPLDPDFRVRLLLMATPAFVATTWVTAAGAKVVYHFTNTISNVQLGNRYITRVIETYNAANSYDAGTVVNHSGEPFASLQPVNGADGIDIGNTAFWKKVLPVEQVANNADLQNTTTVQPQQHCIAVIDVHSTGTTNPTYNLFNGSGHLLSPQYVLPFKSKV